MRSANVGKNCALFVVLKSARSLLTWRKITFTRV